MEQKSLNLNTVALLELLKNYYELSKIRTVIFDNHYNKLIAYPLNDCEFCKLIKNQKHSKKLCDESDKISFELVKKEKKLIIYHCHAGLVEATFPLIQDDIVIGYIMFGQISDEQNKEQFISSLEKTLKRYGIKGEQSVISKIKYRNEDQIKAAAKLLETCAFYVLLKDYIRLSSETFLNNLNKYIDEHINEDISIDDLTSYFKISKSNLYQKFNEYNKLGIASYIRLKKIEKAKDLLKNTNLKVIEISTNVGFNDYNYFCRIFKKIVGISAKKFRNNS